MSTYPRFPSRAELLAHRRRPSWTEYLRAVPWLLPAVLAGWWDRLKLRLTPAVRDRVCPRCGGGSEGVQFFLPQLNHDGRMTPAEWICWRCGHCWRAADPPPEAAPTADPRDAVIAELTEACYALKVTHTEWANAEEIALALDQADLAVDRAERVLAGKAVPR